ncbi:hypothetical protein ACN28I_08350 [Archangium gephyra]
MFHTSMKWVRPQAPMKTPKATTMPLKGKRMRRTSVYSTSEMRT